MLPLKSKLANLNCETPTIWIEKSERKSSLAKTRTFELHLIFPEVWLKQVKLGNKANSASSWALDAIKWTNPCKAYISIKKIPQHWKMKIWGLSNHDDFHFQDSLLQGLSSHIFHAFKNRFYDSKHFLKFKDKEKLQRKSSLNLQA